MLAAAERFLITLWAGALWSVGYMVVPVLFSTLDDPQMAGMLAGEMFLGVGMIGIVCGSLLLATVLTHASAAPAPAWRSPRVWLIVAMILLVLADFMMQQMLAGLKAGGLEEGTRRAADFASLHGVASAVYMVESLLALVLVVVGTRPNRPL